MPEMYPNVDRRGGADDAAVGLSPALRAVLDSVLAEEFDDGVAQVNAHIADHQAGQARARDLVSLEKVTEENSSVLASADVRALANRERVFLSNITATGVGGRITREDVRAYARLRQPLASVMRAGGRFPHPTPEFVNARASYPGWLAAARKAGPEPTLFATGNLPPFTASGIDVNDLMRVPWQARPALAATPSRAAVLATMDDVLTSGDPEAYAGDVFARTEGVQSYLGRVSAWLSDGQHALLMGTPIAYPSRRVAGLPSQITPSAN